MQSQFAVPLGTKTRKENPRARYRSKMRSDITSLAFKLVTKFRIECSQPGDQKKGQARGFKWLDLPVERVKRLGEVLVYLVLIAIV
jgi:hypothetical protein